jgi:hypothetical protein
VPITKTNTRRYVALCDVADCGWSWGPHGLRVTVSEQLRHHLKTEHGIRRADDNPTRRSRTMKTADKELPEQNQGPKLSDYEGQLIVVQAGWTEGSRDTSYGARPTVEASIWVYDEEAKEFDSLGAVPIFFRTVQSQLKEAGSEDDFGGVLLQGTDRNKNEWHLATPSAAQAKLLAKFDASF